MSLIKIQKGTVPDNNETLCRSCRFGTCILLSHGKEIIDCGKIGKRMTEKVTKCSSYINKSLPALSDLYETAWILETSKNKRTLGFTPWSEFKNKNPNDPGHHS